MNLLELVRAKEEELEEVLDMDICAEPNGEMLVIFEPTGVQRPERHVVNELKPPVEKFVEL
jgi:hypothetical protein